MLGESMPMHLDPQTLLSGVVNVYERKNRSMTERNACSCPGGKKTGVEAWKREKIGGVDGGYDRCERETVSAKYLERSIDDATVQKKTALPCLRQPIGSMLEHDLYIVMV